MDSVTWEKDVVRGMIPQWGTGVDERLIRGVLHLETLGFSVTYRLSLMC